MPLSSVRIDTPRLTLRTVTAQDAAGVAASWRLDEPPLTLPEALGKIAWMEENHARSARGSLAHLCLVVVLRETGAFIGWCGLDNLEPARPNPVIFYLLKAEYWGQGYATEAAGALLETAFCELALARVDGGAEFANAASKRVMEKVGMRYLGLDAEGGHAFTISREEFLAARGAP